MQHGLARVVGVDDVLTAAGEGIDGFGFPVVVVVGEGGFGVAEGEAAAAPFDILAGHPFVGIVLEVVIGVLGDFGVGGGEGIGDGAIGVEAGVGLGVDDVFEQVPRGAAGVVAVHGGSVTFPSGAVPVVGFHGFDIFFATVSFAVAVVGVLGLFDVDERTGTDFAFERDPFQQVVTERIVPIVGKLLCIRRPAFRITPLNERRTMAIWPDRFDFNHLTRGINQLSESSGGIEFLDRAIFHGELVAVCRCVPG